VGNWEVGTGSDDWSLGCRFGNPLVWERLNGTRAVCVKKRNGPTAHRSKEIVPGAVTSTGNPPCFVLFFSLL
jgi:hypothetical protein